MAKCEECGRELVYPQFADVDFFVLPEETSPNDTPYCPECKGESDD